MIRIFGNISLWLAFCFAFIQGVLPLLGYQRKNPYLIALARPAALGQFFCLASAYILLTIAFANSDFSIAYVAANSHPSLPLMYRLTALWGAHEGSVLLWIVLLSVWTLIFTFFQRGPLVIAILGVISFSFLGFLVFTSNPFLAAIGPQIGHDLNPLLQDPGFVFHPPMLYMGYVGFSVSFAITLSALLKGNLDSVWAHSARIFALIAWAFLTLGITLGSWWAYRVLGWGGFWFWDPVENASLLPWLSGTALIHLLVLAEKKRIAINWAAILSIITFAFSLLGTFLVRSGVLISAHTFANDPARGIFLLVLLSILIAAATLICILRLPHHPGSTPKKLGLLSREMLLLINSVLLIVTACTILLGTLYPLIFDALHLGTISVGAPYFNQALTPLLFMTMAFMAIAPFSQWRQQNLLALIRQLTPKIGLSAGIAFAILWSTHAEIDILAWISLALSLLIILSIIPSLKIAPGMALAHAGFAILIIGIMLSSLLNEEREVRIQPGNAVTLGPYQFFFLDTQGTQGANYRGIIANFEVLKGTHHVANLHPEKRIYQVREMVMTKVDIHPGIFRDLYIALGEPLDMTSWSVRIYYKPFVRWIWFGGAIMLLGALLITFRRRNIT